ncbi:CybS-domain-containing protein [Melampsora americana]|nr:CybS-domain-containing protein [Melampsora americana]
MWARKTSQLLTRPCHPQAYVKGTINDPTSFPPPNKAHGSIHWTFERSLSAALVPVTAATAIASPNPLLDGVLGVALIMHSHLGFDQILIDYLHDRKFPWIGPIARWTVRALTCGVLVGVYQFNTHDIGLTELIRKMWKA